MMKIPRRGLLCGLGAVCGLCLVSVLVWAAAGSVTYQYDELGRLKATVFDTTANRSYTLDAAGNRTSVVESLGNGALALTVASSVSETVGSLTVTVTRTGSTSGAVGVSYATANGTAVAGSDFTTASGTLNWANGSSAAQTFSVPILNDSVPETVEAFTITLSAPTGGAIIIPPAQSTITITDDDVSDNVAPSAPGALSFSSVTATSATASWGAATDNVSVSVYEYSLNGGVWTNIGNVLSVNISGLTGFTTYTLAVRARDAAGNIGTASSNSFTTSDNVAPSAPGALGFSNIAATNATASWGAATDNVGVTAYEYSVNGGAWTSIGNVLSINISGLSTATTYTVAVRAKDAAGNVGTASSNSFTTLDNVAPGTPGGLGFSGITETSTTASWSAPSDNVGVVAYRYSINGGGWTTLGNVLGVNLVGLTPWTNYTVNVQAGDLAGNWSASSVASFQTLDITPPSVPGTPSFSGITPTSVTANWAAANDNAAVVAYRYNLNGGAWNTIGSAPSSNISGLSQWTDYTVSVQAGDAAGNWSVSSSSNTFKTAAAPPNAPTNLTATAVSGSQVDLTWSASTGGTGNYYYYVYRSINPSIYGYSSIGGTASLNFSDTGAAALTTYYYTVAAYDTVNTSGYSPLSGSASATTLSPPPGQVIWGSGFASCDPSTPCYMWVGTSVDYSVSGPVSYFEVQSYTYQWTTIYSGPNTSFTPPESWMQYRVHACGASGCGPWSSTISLYVYTPE